MKKSGFTLAEVLITLGIIGVVAAMTIPTLIQNTNSVKFQSQFKKSVSTLSQAALMAQAQYDTDYAALTGDSAASNCASDSLSNPKNKDSNDAPLYTMCGLLNSTLAGQTYIGQYGTVKGANASGTYAITTKKLPTPTYFLIFSLADGSFVAFNPEAKGCGVQPGTPIDGTALGSSGALEKCVGFIDVNGANPPNSEVTCVSDAAGTTDATALDPGANCALTAVGNKSADVYPIVFHDGTVEPASNAARATLSRAK